MQGCQKTNLTVLFMPELFSSSYIFSNVMEVGSAINAVLIKSKFGFSKWQSNLIIR